MLGRHYTVNGDLIKMGMNGDFDVIIHGCNCQNVMGSGIAKQIKETFPSAWIADTEYDVTPEQKLGTFSWVKVDDLCIINAYTQLTFGTNCRQVSYDAIDDIFRALNVVLNENARIGYPLIGAGLGGGDWNIISTIIDCAFGNRKHTLVKFKQ